MKIHKKEFIILFSLVFFSCFTTSTFFNIKPNPIQANTHPSVNELKTSSNLSNHNPINLVNNHELENYSIQNQLPGNGSPANPFIIENYLFQSNSSVMILLANIDDSVVIRNSTFMYSALDGSAVKISNCQNIQFVQDNFVGSQTSSVYNYGTISNGLNITTSSNIKILNSYFSQFERGLTVYYSDHVLLSQTFFNSFTDGQAFAVLFRYSSNIEELQNYFQNVNFAIWSEYNTNIAISNNEIYNSMVLYGIALAFFYCVNTTVSSNIIANNFDTGIYSQSDNAIFTNNTFYNLQGSGFWGVASSNLLQNNYFIDCQNATYLSAASGNLIKNNYYISNINDVFIQSSASNLFYDNYFTNTMNFIVILTSYSNKNEFYSNSFLNVTSSSFLIQDLTNTWDNGSYGNYWSNYSGKDSNNDSIGDTKYQISPNLSLYDYYPLMNMPVKLTAQTTPNTSFLNQQMFANLPTPQNQGILQISTNSSSSSGSVNAGNNNIFTNGWLFAIVFVFSIVIIGIVYIIRNKNQNPEFSKTENYTSKSILQKQSEKQFSNWFISKNQQPNKKLCKECNSKLNLEEVFCFNCGAKLD